jgi:hypothetical protein
MIMKKSLYSSILLTLLVSGLAFASLPPANFAGTWVLDKSKSQGLQGPMANADVTMVVTQDDKQFSAETKSVVEGQERSQPASIYKLDGSETTAELTGRMTGKATRKAKWANDGKTLELSDVRNVNFNGNDVTINIKEHWELADDGKTLKLHRVTESPRGTQEVTLVFTKK